ncbi:MAG TPA: IDEAL domain-containing protein [Candidatus Paenibacillus intestinavium]|nr:IDEAL domain-containing protein [Candidatus Paenibacillus intestinavium]
MDKMNVKYEVMLALTAEMILDDALKNYQRNKLETKIDEALATGDEHLFYELSTQLKQLK